MRVLRSPAMPSAVRMAVALAAAAATAAVGQSFFTPDGPVQLVDHASFDSEVVAIEKPVLAMFFAHWCGHCRNAAPEFLKAARSLDGIVKFAAIDCDDTKNRNTCAQYDVKGYPTIKLFPATKRRVPRDYPGERTAQAFLDYAVQQLPLGARKLQADELRPFLTKEPQRPKVILVSTKATSSPMFKSLALDFRASHSFAFLRATKDPMHAPVFEAARTHLGLAHLRTEDQLPALVLVKPASHFASDNVVKYTGPIKYRQVKAWLDEHNDPSATKASKSKANASTAKKTPPKSDIEADVPVGGTYEWRAKNTDKDEQAAAAKLKQNAKSASAKVAAASSSAAAAASQAAASGSSVVSKAAASVSSAADAAASSAEPILNKVKDTVGAAVNATNEALVHAANKVADAASAAVDTDAGAKASGALVNTTESVKDKLEKGGEAVASLFGAGKDKAEKKAKDEDKDKDKDKDGKKAAEKAKGSADALPFETVQDALFSDHLLDSLSLYLGEATPGGAAAWKEQYGAQVEQARQAARDAIRNAPDPAAAQAMALDAERWLLDAVTFDEAKLAQGEDSGEDEFEGQIKLSVEQKRKLNELGKELRARIAKRDAEAAASKGAEAAKATSTTTAGKAHTHDEL